MALRVPIRLAAAAVAALAAIAACSTAPSGHDGANLSVQHALTSQPDLGFAASGRRAPCGWEKSTTYRHVIWIWMENRSYRQILGRTGAARRLASYAKGCGTATNYHAITHPSLPNYLAATSGSTHAISSDCDPSSCPVKTQSLYGQLDAPGAAGWMTYAENMARPCDTTSYDHYAARHNPAVYFTALRPSCRAHDVAIGGTHGRFSKDLRAGRLPGFTFIAPNLCDDGHDCATSTADSWLGYWLDRIARSALYRAGRTVVFVTWDEDDRSSAGNQVAAVVIGPTVMKGTRSDRHFTHYSLLRTAEDLLHVGHLGAAAQAVSMASAFDL